MPGGIARIPHAPRPFSHPAGGVGRETDGVGPEYRVNIPVLVHDREVIDTVGGSESQNVSPERLPERDVCSPCWGALRCVLSR